jgi:thiol-disulfide isomerase/thioredoxin
MLVADCRVVSPRNDNNCQDGVGRKFLRMMNNSFLLAFVILSYIFIGLSAQAYASQNSDSKSIYETGHLYISVDNQMAEIDKTLAAAKQSGKLALIIMGANWCHDSRSMASNLHKPDIKESVEKNYELLFIDVGYYTRIKKVINRFGLPVIYSTPTILIVDPVSEQLINKHNMLLMRDAASVSELETQEYFEDIAANRQQLTLNAITKSESPRLTQLNQTIDDFEKFHADRIYRAFSVIGPLIEEKKGGGAAKEFDTIWKAISKLRYTITDDLARLRKQAKQMDAASDSQAQDIAKELDFPEYPAFEWEKEDAE